ncbi:MAG TPA: amino acid adenylation domain-containing protein, partial [Thermoanaerobaculia bacterium]|nr:amino acid adenylation domain-containing protein [Thermoanaerobaculia bacterium]
MSPLTRERALAANLVRLLRGLAVERPHARAYSFLADGEEEGESLTYAELDLRARALGAALQRLGAAGERALLLYPPGLDFIAAFLGCLYAGAVAVPAYPPRSARTLPRLRAIAADARPAVVLTTGALLAKAGGWTGELPELAAARWLATDEAAAGGLGEAADWREPEIDGDRLAFLQYTSGSTALPKGVMVSHGNLLHNEELIRRAFRQSERSVIAGWLPLYHDMGLIGNVLQPLFVGAPCILMSPMAFLQRPRRWLAAISRYRATTSGGPDFAYELCVAKIPPAEREGLDLHCWEVAFNGAEPVRPATLERFAAAFGPCGFRRQAFYPCYGLAEATLFVSGGGPGSFSIPPNPPHPPRPPNIASFDAASLERHLALRREGEPTPGGAAAVRTLVSCGWSWEDQRLVIADPETGEPCAPGRVGEIWVGGPSVARGYWRRPEETGQVFGARTAAGGGPYLRTGDLGFFIPSAVGADPELFVTGRLKDLIILRGRNHYPHDLEATVEASHPALRPGCGAAFSAEIGGEERLIVVQEVGGRRRGRERDGSEAPAAPSAPEALDPLLAAIEAIRRAVAEEHEVQVYEVVLISSGTIPKTSSGKIQRHACRAAYLRDSLAVAARHALAEDSAEGRDAPLGQPSLSALGDLGDLDRSSLRAAPAGERQALLEGWLRPVVAQVLGVSAGLLHADRALTALGLDSLSAVDLQNRIETALGIAPAPTLLLAGATLGELAAALLAQVEQSAGAREARPEESAGDVGELPLSWGQKALWFLHRLAPASAAYHIVGLARVRGAVDRAALTRALAALVDRHPALRTTFRDGADGPLQRVHAAGSSGHFELIVEPAPVDSPAAPGAVEARLRLLAHHPFDLERGPLLRVALLGDPAAEPWLALAVHHIVSDFWSLEVMARDLAALYARARGVEGRLLPPLAWRYTDFARWQEERMAGPEGERLWSFWRQLLSGALPRLELPTDRPWPAAQTWEGAAHLQRLPARLAEQLEALGRSRGATLYMTLLAAFNALLARSTGQRRLIVGSPTHGRARRAVRELVGYFVNPLPLLAELDGDPDFGALLDATRRGVLAAFAHQELPFALLAERLQPVRDPARSPLFDVVFAFDKGRASRLALGGFALGIGGTRLALADLELESLPFEPAGAPFALTLAMAEAGEELGACWRFNSDLFDRATVARLAAHFRVLLEGVAAEPERRLSELPLLTAEERHQLLVAWNDTASSYPRQAALEELFGAVAARSPAAVAVECGELRLSYGELERRARALAARLAALGVGPERLVGICLERSPELIVAVLASLQAGGAYLPLDPALPAERLGWMLADAGAAVVVTGGAAAAALPVGPWRLLDLSLEAAPAPEAAAEVRAPAAAGPGTEGGGGGDRLAYLMYTSGSTGTPKGVAVVHRAVARLVLGADCARFGPEEVWLQLAPASFDASTLEIWGALLHGGRLVIHPPRTPAPEELGEAIARHGVTSLWLTAGLFHQMVEANPAGLRPLRQLLAGGDVLSPAHVERALAALPECRLINGYGPTEGTTFTCCHALPLGRDGGWTGRSVPLGRPIANSRVYLLGAGGEPVPVGVAGELHAGGDGLARGYWGRPELTAERFVPDPFGPPGARLYRTGDLARHLPDGRLEFLGRLDSQVKVRGFRIEPGEIEAVLAAHPEVRQAAVWVHDAAPPAADLAGAAGGARGRQVPGGDRRLVAYVVPQRAAAPAAAGELRAFLAERLPEAMIPAAFVTLAELPLTANGKVDRRALPAPQWGRPAAAAVFVAPHNPVEELLAGIFEEVLGVAPVGVEDDFFALGGHSLLATKLVSRVRRSLDVELPVAALFSNPTVAAVARELGARAEPAGPGAPAEPLRPRPPDPAAAPPLSFAQERLWFLDRLEPGSPLYNIPAAARLRGPLDPGAFAASLAEIVRRHESLRTGFVEGPAGSPVQVIRPAGGGGGPEGAHLPLIDLRALPRREREAAAARLRAAEAERPFALAEGRPLRALLLRLGAADHLLLLTLHHIAADGWSMGVLMRELALLYGAAAAGRPSPLAALPIQYADFALWQRRWLAGERLAAQLGYWRQALAGEAGLPGPLELPTDRPRPAARATRGARRRFALPRELSAELAALGRRLDATPFMVLLAAFTALLGRWSGQRDLVVGTAIANRNRLEIEPLIGFFVNTLALRLRPAGEASFGELLGAARQAALGAYAHQDLPFEKLVGELAPARDPSRTPLVEALLVLQNAPFAAPHLSGIGVEALEPESSRAKLDLLLDLHGGPAGFAGALEYSAELFDGATVERALAHLTALCAAAVARPDGRLDELPLLSQAERHLLTVAWNDSASALPGELSLGSLFSAAAARQPHAVALECGEERLTYGELERRANRLARHLRALGVGPEVLVGVCLERSPALIVTLLAAVKAGGAYLPLDPSHPAERLAWMLADAGARVLVARAGVAPALPGAAGGSGRLEVAEVDLDRDAAAIARRGAAPLASSPVPPAATLAYLMYTSGSTGRPKGVAVEQRAVAGLVLGTDYARFGPEVVWLQLAPAAFDASTLEIWGALLHGSRLVILPARTPTPEELGEALARHGVTSLWLTAGLFHQMVEANPAGLRPLRQLLAGGEALSPAHVARALAELPGCRLVNGYGPTEGTTFTCCCLLAALPPAPGEPDGGGGGWTVPIGRPIANRRVYLLDAAGQLVAPGVAGELHAAGGGLARGYHGRPDLTAERFVPDPFASEPGARLYRTGDLARYLPDGRIEFLGRIDAQVKVRGFRVEPGEIEAVLATHPAVAAAAVGVHEAAAGDRRLVAYVVAAGGLAPPADELRAFLRERLPEPMVPSAFVALAALPLTANGKLDRRALPAPERGSGAGSGADDAAAAPRTPVEELLASIWCATLGVERVGAHDDFFALGGHSLLATRLISRLRRAFGVELPVAALFDHPTVGGMAGVLAGLLPGGPIGAAGPEQPAEPAWAAAPPLVARPRPEELPLSFAQERLWFLEQLEPGSATYNVAAVVRLDGALAPEALAAAVSRVASRHEALRTTFPQREGRPLQRIGPPAAVPLPAIDLSALPEPARFRVWRRLAATEAERPFDLARGPLLRAVLLGLGAGEAVLLLTVHHIVFDGASVAVLLREVSALYAERVAGEPAGLPRLPVQYADFALWQRQWLTGATLAAPLAAWRQALAGAPAALELPADRPRPAVRGSRGARRPVALPAVLGSALAALARRHDVTPFMVLLAAFAALLGRWSGQQDLVVGSPIANRNRLEIEPLIGFFVNTLALRADLSGDPDFAALLARVRRVALAAYAHQDLPFEKLVEELAPLRDPSRTPLFQAMFVLQQSDFAPPHLPGLTAALLAPQLDRARFDLLLTLTADAAAGAAPGFGGDLEYSTELFDGATAERLLAHFRTLLESAVGAPEQALSELPLLSAAERQQLLAEWVEPAGAGPARRRAHELFEARAAERPAAPALVWGALSWSYGELNARANR